MRTTKLKKVLATLLVASGLSATVNVTPAQPFPGFNVDCDSVNLAGAPFVTGVNCRIVSVDRYPREYLVYVPDSPSFNPAKRAPVVFFFHGSGGGAENAFLTSGWREKADAEGFIAVFGTALRHLEFPSGEIITKWNNFNVQAGLGVDLSYKPPGYPADAPWPQDDLKFTDFMLADVQAGLLVDPRRIYVAGFSNGGGMVLRLAVDRSQVFAAAATAGPGPTFNTWDPPRKMPIYYAIGNRDHNLRDEVNNSPDAPVPPLFEIPLTYAESFGFSVIQERFQDINETFGVPNIPDHIWEFPNELRLRYRLTPPGRIDGHEVIVSIQGGLTHQYPNGSDNPNGFNDTEIFWKFFKQNPFPK